MTLRRRKTPLLTKEKVLDQLQIKISLGASVQLVYAKSKLQSLFHAAEYHFGSWAKAVAIARKLLRGDVARSSPTLQAKPCMPLREIVPVIKAKAVTVSSQKPLEIEEVALHTTKKIEEDIHQYIGLLTRYFWDVNKFPILKQSEIGELTRKVREENDQQARDTLILHSLRLSLWKARHFTAPKPLDYLDLVQEGNLGLMRGIQSYDERLGFRFSTYVQCWIGQHILKFINDWGRLIRVPADTCQFWRKILRTKAELFIRLGREATDVEVAEAIGVKNPAVVSVALWRMAILDPVSLDDPISSENEAPLRHEITPSRHTLSPDQRVEAIETLYLTSKKIKKFFEVVHGKVKPRDYAILVGRYGADNGFEKHTLEEVGQRLNLTRERVRQVLEKIWTNLRASTDFKSENELFQAVKSVHCLEDLIEREAKIAIPPIAI